MFNMDNSGHLIGRVAKTVYHKDKGYTDALIITDIPHRNNPDAKGDMHFVKAFRKTAPRLGEVPVGSLVRMDCHVHTSRYTDQNGDVIYSADIICDQFLNCESRATIEKRQKAKANANAQ